MNRPIETTKCRVCRERFPVESGGCESCEDAFEEWLDDATGALGPREMRLLLEDGVLQRGYGGVDWYEGRDLHEKGVEPDKAAEMLFGDFSRIVNEKLAL